MIAGARVSCALVLCVGALASMPLAAQTGACGDQRWPVKVLLDDDTASVDLTPRVTTVSALVSLPRPTESRPRSGRLALERWTFRVRAILLAAPTAEADSDLHLILADLVDRGVTMVAEIPDSACAAASRHASDYAEARRAVALIAEGTEVEVDGVAFWDSDHGVTGMAPNMLELHPVLRVGPVLTAQNLAGLAAGGVEALRPPADTADVRVWLNTSSRIYHCPGSANYGTTARGEYLPESAARARGARPANGRPCR